MARLIYTSITSLDGYVNDDDGRFDWAEPDQEVHTFVNDLVRPVGTYLFGRKMYETMVYWETAPSVPSDPVCVADFTRIWQAADKVVYSTTLNEPSSARTRIERAFDPGVIGLMKARSRRDLTVGGPGLAARALSAGLVDELHLFVTPVSVGGHPGSAEPPPAVARTSGRAPLRQRGGAPLLPTLALAGPR